MSIINTSTKKVISTVAVGSSPQDVAVAGSKVYVANYNGSSVSVINTAANNSVTTLNVGSKPTSLAVSPDGSMVVVARDDDNIAIIDTKTTTVIGAQHVLDTTTPLGGHVVVFDSNGRILSPTPPTTPCELSAWCVVTPHRSPPPIRPWTLSTPMGWSPARSISRILTEIH